MACKVFQYADRMLRPSFGEPGQCFPFGRTLRFCANGLRTSIIPEAVTSEHDTLTKYLPSDNVGFHVKNVNVKDLKRGYVASYSDDPAKGASSFTSQVIMYHPGQIGNCYTPVLDCHTSHIAMKFSEILTKIDNPCGVQYFISSSPSWV